MNKNYSKITNQEEVNKLMDSLEFYDVYEGTLQDNYIFYNANDFEIEGISRNYIIVKEEYKNVYSSRLRLLMTNDSDIVGMHLEAWEGDRDSN